MPIPETLDWNRWLGVAPERPYHEAYAPFKWRGWWDFGCGALGDIGCHAFDAAFHVLELGAPDSVEADTSPVNDETAPKWSKLIYSFPARGSKPPVTLNWYDGNTFPPRPPELEEGRELGKNGQLFIGEKGTIMAQDVYCNSIRLIPEAKMRAFAPVRPGKTLSRSIGHYQEWLRACRGGERAGAHFEYAGPLTETVLLGNLAIRTGQKIQRDRAAMKCTNLTTAKQYVRRKFRVFK